MAAPSSAYNTLDVTFLSIVHKAARFSGKHNTEANAKSNFHLDKVVAQFDDDTGSRIGFVGAVIAGGTNAGWRASSRLSRARFYDKDTGRQYRLLLDAGLNIQGHASGFTVRYAFCNYFRIDFTAYGAPYEACSVYAALKQTSSASAVDAYNTSGSVPQGGSKAMSMVNRAGLQYWDKKGTYAAVVQVTNSDGTRTLTGTIAFLAALNFDAFIPVSSVTSTPDMSSSGIKTFLIDSVAVDEILNTVKGMSASSLPVAIAFMQGDDNVALLGDGRTSGEASDSFLEAYYKYVKNGTGSYTKAPDGLWVCETIKTAYNGAIRVDLYYGIQIQSGRIRGVFRAKTPQMPDTRPDLRLNINIVSQGNNKYHVSLSLVAAGDTDGAGEATVTINGLHVRQSQTGPSMEGQFTTGTGAMVTFPQTMTYGGRFQIILVFILTTRLTSFWVTADAVCSNSKYKFSNPGGQSGSGGSVVVPTT